jgi:hypothetical protein
MRSRNVCVLAVVASLLLVTTGTLSAAVLWEDNFAGTTLDTTKWIANGGGTVTVDGTNVKLNVPSTNSDWDYAQLTSVNTWTAGSDLYYSFKIGAAPTGDYDMFQVFGGTAQAPYVAMRGDTPAGVNNWVFDVRQNTTGEGVTNVAYHGTLASPMTAGDIWTLKVGPTGSAAYKNGVLFDSTTIVPDGSLMIDAQTWKAPGQSCSQTFDFISVSDTAPVPEPGTIVLTVLALLGLVCYAWRKRK